MFEILLGIIFFGPLIVIIYEFDNGNKSADGCLFIVIFIISIAIIPILGNYIGIFALLIGILIHYLLCYYLCLDFQYFVDKKILKKEKTPNFADLMQEYLKENKKKNKEDQNKFDKK